MSAAAPVAVLVPLIDARVVVVVFGTAVVVEVAAALDEEPVVVDVRDTDDDTIVDELDVVVGSSATSVDAVANAAG